MPKAAKLVVTLETVTPLFLGGADNETPELRPPPFRGMMRYWFRALAGGVLGDSKRALEKVREAEAQVFGSPNDNHGQSAVWIRLSTPAYERYEARVLPHREDKFTNHWGKTLKNYPRPAIPPGVSPTLTLTLKPNAKMHQLELAAWSLLVGLTLGGIGKRSRRGFGSLRVKDVVGEMPSELSKALIQQLESAGQLASTGDDLEQRIGGLLTEARNAFSGFLGNSIPRFSDLPRFPVLKSDTHIVVWTPNALGQDHTAVLSPLMKRLSGLMRDEGERNFAQAFGGIEPRRASPLWVSTHRLQKGGWALVLTHLKARYLPRHAGNKHHLVTEFLNALSRG